MRVPLFDDQEIIDRVRELESKGFPPDACIEFAWALVKYSPGEVAEGVVRSFVERFPDDRLNELVREHVVHYPSPGLDYCQGDHAGLLARELAALGFDPVESGWRVGWPGGEVLEGDDLCRLALLAVWLRRMWLASSDLE